MHCEYYFIDMRLPILAEPVDRVLLRGVVKVITPQLLLFQGWATDPTTPAPSNLAISKGFLPSFAVGSLMSISSPRVPLISALDQG